MTPYWRRGHAYHHECGSASVYAVLLAALAFVMLGAVVLFSGAVATRHRAAGAADLAALAAAERVADAGQGTGPDLGGACQAAGQIAQLNGGELTGCVVAGVRVEVTVERAMPVGPGRAVAHSAAVAGGLPP